MQFDYFRYPPKPTYFRQTFFLGAGIAAKCPLCFPVFLSQERPSSRLCPRKASHQNQNVKIFQPFFPASFQPDLTAQHHLPVSLLCQCHWRCP